MNEIILTDYDRLVYEKELESFLPDKMFDAHVHVSRSGLAPHGKRNGGSAWTGYLCHELSAKELTEINKLLLPKQKTNSLIFGLCLSEIEQTNKFVIETNKDYGYPMLYRTDYSQTPEELEEKVKAGGFLGLKPYISCSPAYIPAAEIRIFDYLPESHLEVANKNGWIVMLHIPRADRLRDPVNIAQIMEIDRKYPNVKLIVAHVGRAYAREDFGNAFEIIKESKNLYFDFTANVLDDAITEAIKCVGVDRVMYGTDLPIALMRMYRIVEGGVYYNVVPKGLYGDVNGQPHMKEAKDGENITFMIYEQLKAFKRSAMALGLSDSEVEKVLFSNADKLIKSVR